MLDQKFFVLWATLLCATFLGMLWVVYKRRVDMYSIVYMVILLSLLFTLLLLPVVIASIGQ